MLNQESDFLEKYIVESSIAFGRRYERSSIAVKLVDLRGVEIPSLKLEDIPRHIQWKDSYSKGTT